MLRSDIDYQVRPSLLQESLPGNVRCHVCERRCTIPEGGLGWCRTRQNRSGVLVTLNYAAVSSLSANPIEKKPFYHFYPGSYALTAGSWSCNFACPWCQNWDISKTTPPASSLPTEDADDKWLRGDFLAPEKFIGLTMNSNCQGTSISFNEPTLSLEWSLDVFRLAKQRNLYNTFVTNGYMTPETLNLLVEAGLDAMNVDLKGDAVTVRKYCKGIDVEKVWRACRLACQAGIHLEITTLVIPGVNDSPESLSGIARRIATELGTAIPWHVSGYYPAYRFHNPPTSLETLERAWQIGRQAGLSYVYLGNLPGHPLENTLCPACSTLLIRRFGFAVREYRLDHDHCPRCGQSIPGVWSS